MNTGRNKTYFNNLSVTGVCCGLTVSESGESTSWILMLSLLHAGVSTIVTMSWILWSMMLHTRASATGMDDGHRGEYCIELTVCRSMNSSFRE